MSGPIGPMWFDPAPPGYPWPVLVVPVNITSLEVSLVRDLVRKMHALLRGENDSVI